MEMQEVHQNIIQDTLDIQPKFSWRTVLEGRPLSYRTMQNIRQLEN